MFLKIQPGALRGRGAAQNPGSRFDKLNVHTDADASIPDEEDPAPGTQFFKNATRSFLSYNDSPDVGFGASINPYRGCEHGCIYCYARPTHEYLGYSAGLDFETKILVKENAPELLRKELSSRRWKPQALAMSSVTDCYQPVERRLCITRRCLEVLADFRNPVCIITKNRLVTRDIDVLQKLAKHDAVIVCMSVTTLDAKLGRIMEPRTSSPEARLEAVKALNGAGVPAGINVAPVIPGLTDHEMPQILRAAKKAGARFAGYTPVRLPHGVPPLFENWLSLHFPDKKEKVLNRIRAVRGGRLNDSRFGTRMSGEGLFAEELRQVFEIFSKKTGLNEPGPSLSTAHFRRPQDRDLFSQD